MKKVYFIGVVVLILAVIIGLGIFDESDKEQERQTLNLEPRVNNEGAVTITITPKNLSDKEWDFEIVLDTHSEELTADLTKTTALFDDKGNEYRPLAWQGDPAGGHHRSGILKFSPLSPRPESITLKILQVGGIEERNFTWQVK